MVDQAKFDEILTSLKSFLGEPQQGAQPPPAQQTLDSLTQRMAGSSEGSMPKQLAEYIDQSVKISSDLYTGPFEKTIRAGISGLLHGLVNDLWDIFDFLGVATSALLNVQEWANQQTRTEFPITLPGVGEAMEAMNRGLITVDTFNSLLQRHGYTNELIDAYRVMATRRLDVAAIQALYNRGTLSESQAVQHLKSLGYQGDNLADLLALAHEYLPPSDLINLYYRGLINHDQLVADAAALGLDETQIDNLVSGYQWIPSPVEALINARRGAYDSEAIHKWGLHNELPKPLTDELYKRGITENIAKQYWAGHWNPLTVTEAFNDFVRGHISRADLDEVMHLNGVPEGARDLTLKAKYHVPEYFVIEAIAGAGGVEPSTISAMVADTGYDPKWIETIAQSFVKKASAGTQKKTTESILKLYKQGGLSKGQAESALLAAGLSEKETALAMQQVELDLEIQISEQQIKAVEKQYVDGYMDQGTAVRELIKFGVGTNEINYWISQWQLLKQAKVQHLTKTELKDAVKHGIVGPGYMLDKLQAQGYTQEQADILVKLALI